METPIKILQSPLGAYQTNAYVVYHEAHKDCWIIDPGYQPEQLIAHLQKQELNPTHILLTHAHMDHIGGLDAVAEAWPEAQLLHSAIEKDWLADPKLNLSTKLLEDLICTTKADGYLTPEDSLDLHGFRFQIRHVPGHSPGSLIFYQPEAQLAIVGDTLFNGGIGRSDLPGADGALLLEKIKSELFTLPDETICCPGHGPATQVAHEKATNPFL